MTNVPVTDADREAYTAADSHEAFALLSALRRMHCDRPHSIFGPPCERCLSTVHDALATAIGVIRRQAIARAHAEGAAEALAALRETLKSTLDWRDEHTNYGKAVRHTMQYVDAAIRARSEGGKA